MKQLTAQQIHEAYCIASPGTWNSDWSHISQSALARYEVMAAYLNAQLAPEESEPEQESEERPVKHHPSCACDKCLQRQFGSWS